MPRFDDATKAFMEKVSTEDESRPVRDTLSTAKNIIKIIDNPQKHLPRIATRKLLDTAMSKEGESLPLKLKPLVVLGFLNTHYKQDWWDWEPETLWQTLLKDHQLNLEDSSDFKNLIMALQLAHNSNAPFEHWHVFEKVGHALSGNIVDFQILQPLEPTECALASKILLSIRPQEHFEPEVMLYIAACAHHAGLAYLPQDLFPGGCDQALGGVVGHDLDSALAAEVKKHWGSKNPLPKNGAARHQLEMLSEIKGYVSDLGQPPAK